MRPLLVLLLVAAAGAAFFFALNAGGGAASTPLPIEGGRPEPVRRVDPPRDGILEGADSRTSAVEAPAPPPQTRALHPEARRGNQLRGVVLDAARRPVADAHVLLTRYGPTEFWAPLGEERVPDRETTSDEQGQFSFADIEHDVDHTIVASHPIQGRRSEHHLAVADGQISDLIEVVLEPGTTVRGEVTDSGGVPIEDAQVRLGLMSVGNVDSGPGVLTTRTDPTGAYEFANASKGHYSLTVRAQGFGKTRLQRLQVSGEGELVHDVTLEVAHLIAGTIRNAADGQPVPGATVEAYSNDRRQETTITDTESAEDGYFEFNDVREGGYTLLVRATGFEVRRLQRINTGEVMLAIELSPLPRITGIVLGPDGNPLRNFSVQLRRHLPNSDQTSPLTNTRVKVQGSEDGYFSLPCPLVGEHLVEALHPRYAPSCSEPVLVEKGDDELSGIIVRMTNGGLLRGQVVDADGDPIAGALIKSHHTDYVDDLFWRSVGDAYPSAATRKETRSDAQGAFELAAMTAETYQLHIDHPDHAELTLRGLVVEDGAARDVGRVRLQAGAALSGTVFGPSGSSGLPGALVEVALDTQATGEEHAVFHRTRTNAEGRYTFHHLPPGLYKLSAQRQGGADNPFVGMTDQKATRRTISLVDGGSHTQDFTLTN